MPLGGDGPWGAVPISGSPMDDMSSRPAVRRRGLAGGGPRAVAKEGHIHVPHPPFLARGKAQHPPQASALCLVCHAAGWLWEPRQPFLLEAVGLACLALATGKWLIHPCFLLYHLRVPETPSTRNPMCYANIWDFLASKL